MQYDSFFVHFEWLIREDRTPAQTKFNIEHPINHRAGHKTRENPVQYLFLGGDHAGSCCSCVHGRRDGFGFGQNEGSICIHFSFRR